MMPMELDREELGDASAVRLGNLDFGIQVLSWCRHQPSSDAYKYAYFVSPLRLFRYTYVRTYVMYTKEEEQQ